MRAVDVGIVGLAGSGRTTVFRALLAHRAPAGAGDRAPTAGIGTIHVQEPRLEALSERYSPKKTTPIEIRLHDLCPGLDPSFSTAEIEAMKRMDALLLVLPAFADPSPEAAVSAFDALLGELVLEDLSAVERRLERAKREKLDPLQQEALEAARTALEAEQPLAGADLDPQRREALRGYSFVTDRSLLAVLNTAEDAAGSDLPPPLLERAAALELPILSLSAALESEMAELDPEDRSDFLAEYGVTEAAGAAVTRAILDQANVVPFFTVGEDECRAWAVARGTGAKLAAGKIHSDIERGFIRAEVIGSEQLLGLPGLLTEARKLGLLRLEGKDYVVEDGDVVHFRFNV